MPEQQPVLPRTVLVTHRDRLGDCRSYDGRLEKQTGERPHCDVCVFELIGDRANGSATIIIEY